ncbi:MAG: hypothetical protein NZZ41_06695 [Candidatus Dojkabacteria bacterium]|nr:hypothetical protein [Candidatus Dojkabacteria bacterium]
MSNLVEKFKMLPDEQKKIFLERIQQLPEEQRKKFAEFIKSTNTYTPRQKPSVVNNLDMGTTSNTEFVKPKNFKSFYAV